MRLVSRTLSLSPSCFSLFCLSRSLCLSLTGFQGGKIVSIANGAGAAKLAAEQGKKSAGFLVRPNKEELTVRSISFSVSFFSLPPSRYSPLPSLPLTLTLLLALSPSLFRGVDKQVIAGLLDDGLVKYPTVQEMPYTEIAAAHNAVPFSHLSSLFMDRFFSCYTCW